jgi:hypothetical protein
LPKFREKLLTKLSRPEQGADTLVWMCVYPFLKQYENGGFFKIRKMVVLKLASTRSESCDQIAFIYEMNH